MIRANEERKSPLTGKHRNDERKIAGAGIWGIGSTFDHLLKGGRCQSNAAVKQNQRGKRAGGIS